jgi:hypothetical protein
MKHKLVKYTIEDLVAGKEILDIIPFFNGTLKQIKGLTLRFEFKQNDNVFGGYWVDRETGDCYFIV